MVDALVYPTILVGDGSQGILYGPAGAHTVCPTTLGSPGKWAPHQTLLHPGPVPSGLSPSFTSATPTPTVQSVIQNGPSVSTNPPDYTLVPQRQYALTAYHFTPAHPISFNSGPGEQGIRLSAALNRRFTHLEDRDDLVFESSRSPTITMRLEVCDSFELA